MNLRGARGRFVSPLPQGSVSDNEDWGFRWGDCSAYHHVFMTILPPNAPTCCSTGGTSNDRVLVPPTSYHTGGVNVAMADASVRFVSETVNFGNVTTLITIDRNTGPSPFGVWGAMGSMAGGEATSL